MKRILIFIFIFSFSIFGELVQDEKLIKGKLDNGLEYFIYPNQKPKNFISARLKVEAGSLYEKEGEEGIAHFLEHMAFNGTEKYKSNDLIRELEKMGVAFGPELNAYTYFDETVYMLDGQSKDLEKFVDILHQWGFKMVLDPKEIEKEKGVVIEEWRQDTGVGKEQREFYQQYIFRGSTYLERMPIGLVASIEAFTRDRVENFYKRWYTPNNMKLYISGDIENIAEVEAFIKKYFGNEEKKELEAKEEYKKRTFEKLMVEDSYINKELRNNQFSFIQAIDYSMDKSQLERLKESVTEMVFDNALQERYTKKLNSLETNLNSIYVYKYKFNDYFGFDEVNIDLKKDKELAGIREAFGELNQIMKGLSQEEFEKSVEYYKDYLNELLASLENVETASIISNLVGFDFEKDVFISQKDEINLMMKYLDELRIEDVDKYIEGYFKGIEEYYLYSGYKALDKNAMKAEVEAGRQIDLGKYEKEESKGQLITKEPVAGKIVDEKYVEAEDYYLLTLSNGSRVYLKDVKYKENTVAFGALSRGGRDYIPTDMLMTAEFFDTVISSAPGTMTREEYIDFTKKRNISFFQGMGKDGEYFYGSSTSKYPEDMLKIFYAYVTEAKIDETQLQIDKQNAIEALRNKKNLKENDFWEEVYIELNGHDERAKIMEEEDVNSIDGAELLDLYKERFTGGDYDYYIVGDIDYEALKPAIEKYLASVERKVVEDYSPIRLKQLSTNKKVVRNFASGEDTNVIMVFGDKESIDENYEYYASMLQNSLDTELIKEVRENLSGAYNISAWVDVYKHDLDRGRLFVSFTCQPERAEELMEAVRKTVKSVLDGNIGDETISYLKESYKRDYERNKGTNDYYVSYFENEIWGEEQPIVPKEYDKMVSKENIMKFMEAVYGMYEGDFVLYPADYEK